jgi:negative regulator of replication initiation
MKTIQIERDLYDYLVSKAAEAGEAPAEILRRELKLPPPTETIEIDDDTYAYLLSKATNIGESASDILRRELNRGGTPPEPPQPEDGVVEFRIAAGTNGNAWNTQATMVMAHVGETLRLVNEDAVPHRLHTSGIPFQHPNNDLMPGQSADFVLTAAYDPMVNGALYDHDFGTESKFWITVQPV